mmetsp:Transcript_25056/g.44553  ORF Transcript_25056/g.44553 Transcript_25056/m.44553 type:complete len:84 (-) Transcript_25056:432-683(-)
MHIISSASLIVESLCAITRTLAPVSRSSSSIAEWTSASFFASRLEVASSRMRIGGFATSARAMAIRCLCPPESLPPISPARVS